jgi:GT2 family glycosyltransferase
MSSTPLVSAIILNYRSSRDSWKCVLALRAQTIADQLEILLVDNHSCDDSIGYLRNRVRASEPSVRVLESGTNIGYGQGNELGVQHAKGQYVLIINPDNELEPDALEKMVEEMRRDPSIGIIAPQLVHEDGTIRDSYRTFPTASDLIIKRTMLRKFFPDRMRHYLQHDRDMSVTRDVDWVAGACLLIKRDFYLELGGFDPRFFLFFEDTDLCKRTWKAGKRVVYFPAAKARDRKHRLSEGGLLALFTKKTARIHLASAVKYFWKWRGVPGGRGA